MPNLNSKVGSPEFSEDNLRKKLDALIVENRELKMSREIMLSNADRIREQLAARVRFLERKYEELHSQVSGYLHGEDWEHWQKFNAAKFNPPNAKDDGAGVSPAPVHRLVGPRQEAP